MARPGDTVHRDLKLSKTGLTTTLRETAVSVHSLSNGAIGAGPLIGFTLTTMRIMATDSFSTPSVALTAREMRGAVETKTASRVKFSGDYAPAFELKNLIFGSQIALRALSAAVIVPSSR